MTRISQLKISCAILPCSRCQQPFYRTAAEVFADLDQETGRLFTTGTNQLSDPRALTSHAAVVTHWQEDQLLLDSVPGC